MWGALLAAIPSIYQGIQGMQQQKKAAGMNMTRPGYQISPYLYANKNMYDTLSQSNRLPGQSIIEDKLNQSTEQGVNNLKNNVNNPNDLAGGITALNRDNINATNELGIAGSQARLGAVDRLAGANDALTEANNAKNQWDTYDPYLQFMAAKSALQGAGMQNVQQGLNGIASIGSSAAMSGFGGESKGVNTIRRSRDVMPDQPQPYMGNIPSNYNPSQMT